MFALRITVNGRSRAVAGAEDLSVLAANITLVGPLGARTVRKKRDAPDMMLHVGGLTARAGNKSDEHLDWLNLRKMKVGDKVTVEIIETSKTTRIVRRAEAQGKSSGERALYEHAKTLYLDLKKKYEPES